jgi:isoamylase
MTVLIGTGEPLPLGMTETCDGFNFAVFSRHASRVSLLLFEGINGAPIATVALNPTHNRTGDIWHAALGQDLKGKNYVLKVEGPWAPEEGHRFDSRLALLDPYAAAVIDSSQWQPNEARSQSSDTQSCLIRGLIADHRFDWQDDKPPRHSWSDTVIYETHVRGLTIHPSSGANFAGCYAGVIEKITYLRELGITAIELMPAQEFRQEEMQ